jgi:hypothetical protein
MIFQVFARPRLRVTSHRQNVLQVLDVSALYPVARAELQHMLASLRELSKQLLFFLLALSNDSHKADNTLPQFLIARAVFALVALMNRRDIVGALALVVRGLPKLLVNGTVAFEGVFDLSNYTFLSRTLHLVFELVLFYSFF